MALTLDSTLADLLKDPRAKAEIEKAIPGLTTNPMVSMVSGMSLRQLVSMPQAAQLGVTQQKVEAILAEVNKQM
jgi:hypothetical protein